MKIKRFNENGKHAINFKMTEDVDHEYIKQCFIDFIDAGAHTDFDEETFTMSIVLPVNLSNIKGTMMRQYIEGYNKNNEFYKELGRCFYKLEDEYPDLIMNISPGDASVYIMITKLLRFV